ncbi:uncharacterized protein [Ptychodera flava]|uniref:uncharacterized protein n=1 Tax=Ptychodera flava TaxID=63121 RepID=UPI00396A0059
MDEKKSSEIGSSVTSLVVLVTSSILAICFQGVSSFEPNLSDLHYLEISRSEVLAAEAPIRVDPRGRRSNGQPADSNENTPYFVGVPYEGAVPINAKQGYEVLRVTAKDNDEQGTCNANITYSLQPYSGTLDFTYFTIDRYDGTVFVGRRFDDDESDQGKSAIYEFLVKASDGGCWSKHNETLVKVFIWLYPIFDIPGQFYKMRTFPVEGETKHSWCEDIPQASFNGSFKYIIKAGNIDGRFAIDADTGRICNNAELDREEMAEYYLLISTSIDSVGQNEVISNNPMMPSYCQDLHLSELCVLITVGDINDNIPVFTKPVYTIAIYYDIPPGTNVIKVTASDEDSGNYSKVSYELTENVRPFAIQRLSGKIYTTELLNTATSGEYELYVMATDNYGDGNPSASSVKVKIITTSITNAVVLTSNLLDTDVNLHKEELVSDLEKHLQLDVAILDIGVTLSENGELIVDSTDIWFTRTYPQTYDVVRGTHIMLNPLTEEFKSKWSINSSSLGSQNRWKNVEPVNASTSTLFIVLLVVLLILLLMAITFIVILILRDRQTINPPFLKYLGGPISTSKDDSYEMPSISKPFNFPPAHELRKTDIQIISKIGEGNFGSVDKAELKNLGGQSSTLEVAVKSIKRDSAHYDEAAKSAFDKELKVISSLEYHPNVITCIGFVTVEDPMLFVFEFAPQGELLKYLKSRKASGINQDRLVKFTLDVAKGMEYLSSKSIIHRDLAARNVLVSGDTCKISDFGLSRLGAIYVKLSADKIPTAWTAPECLVASEAKYNVKTDVWSFGVLMWEIMSFGQRPYNPGLKNRLKEYLEGGGRLAKPEGCPDQIYEVMKKCWQLIQNDRPTFRRLVNDIDKIHCDLMEELDGREPADSYDDVQVPADMAYEKVRYGAQLSEGYDDITVHITDSDQNADGFRESTDNLVT